MRIVTIREVPDDENLRQRWNALVDRMDQPQIFYTYEWATAVQRAYSSSLHPLVLLFYDQDALIGLAALATPSRGEACFLGSTTADYCDVVTTPTANPAIVDALLAELRKLSIEKISLANLPADSPTAASIRQVAKRNRFHLHVRDAYLCARVELRGSKQRAAIKTALDRKQMYRRAVRKLEKLGFEIVQLRQHSEVAARLPDFYENHVSRFRASGRVSIFETPERRKFLDELARELCRHRLLVLSCLRIGNKVAAWNYGFAFRGTWFWYQPTFDSDYEKVSPGFVLLTRIIEESCESPEITVVDLGLGAEEYKDRFATSGRQTLYITLSWSWTSHARTVLRYRASMQLKKWPFGEKMFRRARHFVLMINHPKPSSLR